MLKEKNYCNFYNQADQLITKTDPDGVTTYAYDNRGNLNLVMENEVMKYRYTYGALNHLEEAVNAAGERATYRYNGLGHRIGTVNYVDLDGKKPVEAEEQKEDNKGVFVLGGGAWQAKKPDGGFFGGGFLSIGLGGNATVASGHVNMSETTRLISYNIFTMEWINWEDDKNEKN